MQNIDSDWQSSLPDSLNNPEDVAKIRQMVTQWSRLVAWSWTPCLAHSGDVQKATQEQALKAFFSKTLKAQALHKLAFEAYAQKESKQIAQDLSKEIKYLVLGQNDQIEYLKTQGISVTLSDVTQKLTNIQLISTKDPNFGGMFIYNVVLSQFTGKITQVTDEDGKPVKDQYYAEVGYPATPAFNEATVTELQLSNWVYNINQTQDSGYLPPSPYIAFGFC
jgi:hypothetical protein